MLRVLIRETGWQKKQRCDDRREGQARVREILRCSAAGFVNEEGSKQGMKEVSETIWNHLEKAKKQVSPRVSSRNSGLLTGRF